MRAFAPIGPTEPPNGGETLFGTSRENYSDSRGWGTPAGARHFDQLMVAPLAKHRHDLVRAHISALDETRGRTGEPR